MRYYLGTCRYLGKLSTEYAIIDKRNTLSTCFALSVWGFGVIQGRRDGFLLFHNRLLPTKNGYEQSIVIGAMDTSSNYATIGLSISSRDWRKTLK